MDLDVVYSKSDQLWTMALEYTPKLLLALVTLVIGLWIIKAIVKGVSKVMDKRDMDPTLTPFVVSLFGILLKVMLFSTVVGLSGAQMSPFIATFGDEVFAVGRALL